MLSDKDKMCDFSFNRFFIETLKTKLVVVGSGDSKEF